MADNGLPPPPPGVQWADSSSLPPPPPGVKWADQSPASQPAVSLDNVQGSASTTATPQGRAIDMTSQPGEATPPAAQPAAAPAASGSVAPAQPPPAAGPTAAPGMPAPPQGPPQTSHDAAYQNALTPPDVTQSAIPPPLSPNPPMPPPPAGVLPPAPAPGAPPAPAPSESFMAPIERGADNLWNSATSQIGQMASGAAQVAKQVWNNPLSATSNLGNVGSAAAEHFSGQLLSTGGQMLRSADQTVREHLFHQNDLNRIAVLKVTDPAKAAVMQAHLDATLADPSWVGQLGGILTGRGATIQAKAFSDLSPQDQRDVSAKVTDGHYNIKAAVYDLSQQAAPVAAGAAVGLLLRNPAEGEVIAGLTERAAAGGADSVMAKAGLQAANSIAKRNLATAGLAGGFTSAGLYATQTAVDVHDTIIHDKTTLDNPEVKGLIASGMKPDSAVSMYATLQMNKAYFPAVAFWTAASTLPGLHFGEGAVAEKASALLSGAGHGAIQGGGNQMIANDASGQPLMQDVGKSAATMAGITAPFGLMHGDAGKPEDMAGRNGAASESGASKAAQPFNDAANNYAKAGTDPADIADRQSKVSAIQAWGDANGGRTPAEKSAALKQLATTGELPDYVKSPAVTTPRAASVTDQLAKQGIQAPVAPDGRVTVPPDLPKASDAFNAAAHDAAESPHNDFQPVTPGQALHGNYRVGKSLLKGNTPAEDLKVNIENPAGSIRKAPDGSWQQKMTEHYGYFPGTHGADGQPLDLVAGRKAHDPSLPVFVVHQTDVTTGAHDELKVVLGAKSEGQAKQMYLNQYPRTLHDKLIAGTPKIVKMSRPQFAQWMKAGDHATPVSPISKQPIPALRQEGEVHASFDKTAQSDDLQARADALSKAHGVPLKVSANGEGHSITGTIPKAKLPAIDRALRGIDGHQETTYNGADASTVFSGGREGGGGRVPAPGRSLDNGQLTGGQQRAQPSHGDRPQAEGAPKEAPTPGWLKKVTSDAPLFQRGQGAHPSSVVGVHYSKKGDIEALDPDRSGSSSPERGKLLRAAGNPAGALAQAVHFYVRQGDELPVKEPRVGGTNPHAYEARLNNLYDVAADPDGILQRAEDRGHATGTPVSHDAIVKAILKAGYDGTVHRGVANDTPVATVFGSDKIPVRNTNADAAKPAVPVNENEARMTDKVGVGRLPDELAKPHGKLTLQGNHEILRQYKLAHADKPAFDAWLSKLAEQDGGKAKTADLKDRERTEEKITTEYHGDASRVNDLLRGSVIVKTTGQAKDVADAIRKSGMRILKDNDSIHSDESRLGGYRDINLVVERPNGGRAEVQVHLEKMMQAKEIAHSLYKDIRPLLAKRDDGEPLSKKESAEIGRNLAQQHAIYDPAFAASKSLNLSSDTTRADDSGLKSASSGNLRGGSAEKSSALNPPSEKSAIGEPSKSKNLVPEGKSITPSPMEESDSISHGISKETYDGFSEGAGNDATGTTGVRESAPHDNGATGEGSAGVRPVRQRDAAGPEVRSEARPADAVTKQRDGADVSPDSSSANHATEGAAIQEVPVADLQLSSDVPQFKSGANDKGVVEPLGGKFDRRGTGPIQVWRRTNGKLEVISGRHRLDLARRSGEQTIPAQVYNEADGFDARKAASLDAELNIRDGQGKVKDYVNYFQNSGIDETTADARGLLARATGKRAHAIATQGDAGLIAAHSADRISDEAAVQIAQAAPNNGRLQALGMKLVQEGRPITVAASTMRAVRTMARSESTSDMFGFDDSAIKDAEKIAQAASAHQRDISERLAAITGASKRPDLAKREGINVRNPEAVQQRVEQLRAEKDAWSHFDTDPAKMDQLRQELGMEKAPEPEVTEPKPATSGGDMFGAATTSDHIRAAQEGKDAQRNGLTGGKADTGEGGLFDGKRPLQERVPDAEVTGSEKPRLKMGEPAAEGGDDAPDTPAFRKWFGGSKAVNAQGKPLRLFHGTGNLAEMDRFNPELTGQGNDQIGSGFYFTTDPDEASGYATSATSNASSGARKLGGDTTPGIVPVYLSIKNPIRVKGHNLIESGVNLTAKRVEAIIRRAPGLMDPEKSPIGNWHDVSNGGVKPWMVTDVAKTYVGENLLSLEGDFFHSDSAEFRRALSDVTGHDGVVQDFGDGKQHWVAWFPEQIKSATGNRGTFDPNNPDIRMKVGDQADESSNKGEDHVKAIDTHVQKIRASWKGAPETKVVNDRSELPPEVRDHIDVMGGVEPDGLYYGGKVYLIGKALNDPAHAERVLVHETLGHHGLRYTFGDKLPGMLQSVFDAVKTKPEFLKLANRYRQSYAGMKPTEFNHAITEEYLSNGAELQKNPGVLSKVVAFVRNWARGHGMVHDWSENDVVNLMHGVAQNVRQGRVSRFGYRVPTTTFDNDARTATSSYQGAAGEGTVTHLPGGDRVLAVGGMSARLTRTMTDEGMGLEVSNLKYSDPKDLLAITRFAGEEGKSAVLFPKEAQDDLDRAHIPNEVVGDRVQTPSSTLPPGPPRLSMRNPGGKPDDPDLTERMDRTIAKRETEMSPWDRLQHLGRQLADKEAWRDRLRAGFAGAVDQFAPLARIEKEHGGTGKLLDASESAYKAAWMSQNVQAVMGSVVRDGIPVYRDGGFQTQAGRKGWVDILSPLYQHADPEMERKFSFYLGTVRGERLLNEINPDGTSREKNFTPDDIAAGKALEAKFPFFKTVADDIQQFNHHLIDLAVERGNMTPETGEAWKANFYVPFYRAMEEEGMASPGQTGGLKVKSKYLSGGGKIEPPLDSMLQNTMAILDRVYKNEAVRRAIAMGQEAGLIHPIGMALDPKQFTVAEIEKRLEDAGLFVGRQANGQRSAKLTLTEADRDKYVNLLGLKPPIAPGSDVTYAMHNGRAKFYRVDDPQVLRAITDITQQKAINRWFSTLIGGPARLLRNLTVHTPSFMFRHLFRQTLDAQLQSSQNPVLLRNSLRSSIDAYTQGPLLRQLAMAGSGGNEYYQIDQMHEEMRRLSPHATILDAPRKLAMAYHKVGYVADQMNRLSVAKGVLDRGGSTAEAAWQAQDLLNFGMHGGNIAVRYLMKAVPFLNARTQGAYRIVRGATGADSPGKVATALGGRLAKGFLYKGALFTAAALALQAKNNNDPRYEKLSDQQKDMYFNFFVGDHHYALPIPFELGAIFATLPSRLLRRAEGIDDNKVLWQSIQRTVESTMRLDPTDVAMITPLWEDQMNKDKLSQRAIVSERYSHIDPKEQFTPYTSPVIKAAAQHMPDAAPDMLRSPLRLQHLVYGYFSTVGRYAVDAADAMARVSGKAPVAPASNSPIGSLGSKVFGAMVSRSSTDPRNSAESTLDDNYRRLVQVGNTINAMKKNGDVEQLNRYYATNGSIMQYKVPLKELYDQMGNAHKAEAEIYQSTTMTADEKRTALNKITKERDALLQQYAPLLRLVDETN